MTAVALDSPAETALVADAVAGDPGAFARLVERHRAGLLRHCDRLLKSPSEAEDAVQETLLRAWRALDGFAGRAKFRTWLYQIATHTCLDELGRRGRRDRLAGAADLPVPIPPDVVVEARETLELAFLAAIEILPPRQRAVLILRDVLRWSVPESAELLGMTVAAANSALQRARATLTEHRPSPSVRRPPDASWTTEARSLLDGYVAAVQRADADAVARVVCRDVRSPRRAARVTAFHPLRAHR